MFEKRIDNKIRSAEDFFSSVNLSFSERGFSAISFVNPFSYKILQDFPDLIDAIDIFFSDGAMLTFLHSIFVGRISRASFDYSSVADSFFSFLANNQKTVAIIGATKNENKQAVERIQNRYPGLNIVYSSDGYFLDNVNAVTSSLIEVRPDVILIGMGTPHQEQFIFELKKRVEHSCLAITCGGFLTQTALRDDYYYPIIKKTGLRWLQRMVMHDHVRKKVFLIYPKFLCSYIRGHIS